MAKERDEARAEADGLALQQVDEDAGDTLEFTIPLGEQSEGWHSASSCSREAPYQGKKKGPIPP